MIGITVDDVNEEFKVTYDDGGATKTRELIFTKEQQDAIIKEAIKLGLLKTEVKKYEF